MEVIVIKYVQLVCLTIFMSNNASCDQLMIQSEQMNNYKVAACVGDCLKAEISNVSFMIDRKSTLKNDNSNDRQKCW